MSTDLILINCPVWAVSEPPLGLAYLAAYLGEAEFSIKVIDLNIQAHLIHPAPIDGRDVALLKINPLLMFSGDNIFFRTYERTSFAPTD